MTPEARQHELGPLSASLRERVKELRCLYAVSQIIAEADVPRAERLRRIAAELPHAWRFPDRAVASIALDGERFESRPCDAALASQRADLVVEGVRRGAVEVGYPAASPGAGQELLLAEESNLLEHVARQLSLYVTRQEGAARRAELEAQLRHSDRLATVGQLAAGVAHEMNEPLSSVLGLAQLALKAPGVPPSVVDDLRGIVAASLRAREIVKKLLLFARQAPPTRVAVDLNDVVEETVSLLEGSCENPRLRFLRQLAVDLPIVQGDSAQLRQVLVNLAINAMQAIADEGTVTVETRAEGAEVALVVRDSGHGMPPDVLSQVFNPFFTTKGPGEGTGLGLSVVHGIVVAHGGSVAADSRVGGGSCFTVRLPAAGGATGAEREAEVAP
jgi:signal transduction histidine kinase